MELYVFHAADVDDRQGVVIYHVPDENGEGLPRDPTEDEVSDRATIVTWVYLNGDILSICGNVRHLVKREGTSTPV